MGSRSSVFLLHVEVHGLGRLGGIVGILWYSGGAYDHVNHQVEDLILMPNNEFLHFTLVVLHIQISWRDLKLEVKAVF